MSDHKLQVFADYGKTRDTHWKAPNIAGKFLML